MQRTRIIIIQELQNQWLWDLPALWNQNKIAMRPWKMTSHLIILICLSQCSGNVQTSKLISINCLILEVTTLIFHRIHSFSLNSQQLKSPLTGEWKVVMMLMFLSEEKYSHFLLFISTQSRVLISSLEKLERWLPNRTLSHGSSVVRAWEIND
jgi:hypothetical protein